MESIYDGPNDQVRSGARRVAADVAGGAENMRIAASAEFKRLIADIEDLVARIADVKDAEVVNVRSRVEHTLAAAKLALGNGASTLKRQARQAADSADGYVHENPWQALGVAALVGVAIGLLATRRS
ncbi:MAG: DUF883 family protein [Steroidobacteraceae bacterium]|jgi:ElaB/YqjD/DUF883 family membrane-anchored ribosome-binding protein